MSGPAAGAPSGRPAFGRRGGRLLLWLLVVGLLLWVARSVSPAETWRVLRRLGPGQLLALAGANGLVLLVLNTRWWLLADGRARRLPFLALAGYRLAAFGVSYLTPGPQFGGEPLQAFLLARGHGVPRSQAIAAVTVDKLFEMLGSFAFLTVGVVVILDSELLPGWLGSGAVVLALALLSAPLLILAAIGSGRRPASSFAVYLGRLWLRLRRRPAPELLSRLGRLAHESETESYRLLRRAPGRLAAVLVVTIASWLALMAEYWLMLNFLGVRLTALQVIVALTAARLAFLLPLPGGLGSLEASQLLVFEALGFGSAAGISAALIIRARDLLLAALGVWWGGRRVRANRSRPLS